MSVFDIKIIAILAMIIDHIGLFFFPNLVFLRVVGRLSFPLFAWLIANGAYYTHDINRYLGRILVFAFISQIPFTLANNQIHLPFYLNVLFTLFLGLVAIKIIKQTKDKLIWGIAVLACALLAAIINSDYGAAGVLSIVAFYLFFNNHRLMFLSQALVLTIVPTVLMLSPDYLGLKHGVNILSYLNVLGLFSFIFIFSYNKKQGPKTKYLFYIFYPLQYVVIFLLKTLF